MSNTRTYLDHKDELVHIDPLLRISQQITTPSPVEEVDLPWLTDYGVRLRIKREDLIHPLVSGNKWRKLKGNIRLLDQKGHRGILTYGGAFSNHLHATAAAAHLAGVHAAAIVRGEYDEANPTLQFCKAHGMQLHFVSRSDYRLKEDSTVIQELLARYPDYLPVPEGGSSKVALLGLAELAREIDLLSDVDMVTVSAGTGMTAAGLIRYQDVPVRVYSALKADYLKDHIAVLAGPAQYTFVPDYPFGGYGRTTDELIVFINTFFDNTGIPLDPIYNGKALYGICKDIRSGAIAPGSSVMHIHTGGLQGVEAYNYMAQKATGRHSRKKIQPFLL